MMIDYTDSKPTDKEKIKYLEQRLSALKTVRSPFYDKWREIAKFISPMSGRFDIHNHGEDRSLKYIYDSEATRDLNVLSAGLLSGASSPARPWFRISAPDFGDKKDNHECDLWCAQVQNILLKVFQKSNTYNSLYNIYKELALFGIAADIVYDDYNNIIEHHVLTAGEFCVAADLSGQIDTLYYEYELTTAQAVRMFGYDKCSKDIQRCFDRHNLTEYFTFVNAIEPRIDRDWSNQNNKNMPYASYYWELGARNGVALESGFDEFPVIAPRWEVLGIDAYGTSPSFNILPDVKQLQQEVMRKCQLVDQFSNPPLQVPNVARQQPISMNAGALNFTYNTGSEQTIKPMISGIGDLNALRQDVLDVKQAIKDGYYVDLFLMLSNNQADRKTTVEVNALQQEKMIILGQVVERNNKECLAKLITMTYNKLMKANLLPPAPEAFMQGAQPEISFESVLAQAQKAVDVNTVDRTFSAIAACAQLVPEVLDRINPDGIVDAYKDHLSSDPRIFRSKEEADGIRQQRAEAQQQQAQMDQMQQGAQALDQFANAQKSGAETSLATQQLDEVGGGMGGIGGFL